LGCRYSPWDKNSFIVVGAFDVDIMTVARWLNPGLGSKRPVGLRWRASKPYILAVVAFAVFTVCIRDHADGLLWWIGCWLTFVAFPGHVFIWNGGVSNESYHVFDICQGPG